MVLKQKEELLRAFAGQLSKSLKRFESSRKMRLKFILKTIYGCTAIEVKQYCAMFGIHEQTSVKDVPPLFWAGNASSSPSTKHEASKLKFPEIYSVDTALKQDPPVWSREPVD